LFVRGLISFIYGFSDFYIDLRDGNLRNGKIWYPLYNLTYYSTLALFPTVIQILMLRFMTFNKKSLNPNENIDSSQLWSFISEDNKGLVLKQTSLEENTGESEQESLKI
jgi:hypothetical protein